MLYWNQLEIQLLHNQQRAKASGHIVAFSGNDMWNIDIFDKFLNIGLRMGT